MKRTAPISILTVLLLAGCSGGVVGSPMTPEETSALVEDELGIVCSEFDESSSITCAEDEESLGYLASELGRIQWNDRDDGSFETTILSVKHTDVDRDRVLSLLARYGFSEEDYDQMAGNGQRITRGAYTMTPMSSETLLIAD